MAEEIVDNEEHQGGTYAHFLEATTIKVDDTDFHSVVTHADGTIWYWYGRVDSDGERIWEALKENTKP